MSELRLVLLIVGVAIVVGVFLFSRRRWNEARSDDQHVADLKDVTSDINVFREPSISDVDVRLEDAKSRHEPIVSKSGVIAGGKNDNRFDPAKQKIVALHIMPSATNDFAGNEVRTVLTAAGLSFGKYKIFHRESTSHPGNETIFSVANMMEPGSFDLESLDGARVPGLALFMVLPGPLRGVDAFADLLATARRIASELGGEVKDENRSTLTKQTAHHIRESIIEFEHQLAN
ncbi:MAG: cell division protein ZipA [Gammaproteobacteria bacterium]|nr:cell division protein ZipA [Gammaproteobacteria bacterium]